MYPDPNFQVQTPYAYYPPGPYIPEPPAPPELVEKRSIKRHGNALGAAFCLSNVAVSILQIILVLIVTVVLGAGLTGTSTLVSDPMAAVIMQLVFSVLMFTVPFLISAKVLKHRISDLLPLHKVKFPVAALIIGAGLMVCMVANIAAEMLSSVFTGIGIPPHSPSFAIPSGTFGVLLYFLTISVAPALVEEFALRGVVLGSLRQYGDGFAILASAGLFGLMHGNLVQIPFAFILGLLFGYITIVTNSMWPAIIIHFLNNLSSGLLEYISGYMSVRSFTILSYAFMITLLLIGMVCIIYLLKRNPELFHLKSSESKLNLKSKFGAFSASAGIVFTFILYGLTIVFVQFSSSLV